MFAKPDRQIHNGPMPTVDTAPFPETSGLSRTRKSEPYIQQKVNLPATLAARFAQLHWDPVLQKTRYGALSQVMTKLVADYVNKVESGTIPAEDIKIEAL